jgi:flavodoxin
MRVLVLYESRRGFTLTVARAIRDELRARGIPAGTAALPTVDAGTLAAADALVVGTWVAGKIVFGVGPATGAVRAIRALPDLEGRPVATFCTCDVAPRGTLAALEELLRERGATVVGGFTFKRRASLRHVVAYVDAILPAVQAAIVPSQPATS